MANSYNAGYGTSNFNINTPAFLNYPQTRQAIRAGQTPRAPKFGKGNVYVQNFNFDTSYRGWGTNAWAGFDTRNYCDYEPSKFGQALMYGGVCITGLAGVAQSIMGLFKKGSSV